MKSAPKSHVIFMSDGEPLSNSDIPSSFKEAHSITDEWNKEKGDYDPKWSFDCNYKLDFDGSLISISSRFYPPTQYYGEGWDGVVHFFFLGKALHNKKFKENTLSELRTVIENYISEFNFLEEIVKKAILEHENL